MLNIGIIGTGGIAKAHLAKLEDRKDINIAAVADINEGAANLAAEKNNACVYTDYRDLLASDIAAVFIFTPPFVHKEQVIDSARAGKHIFCEKPLALTLEDADEMLRVVDEAKVKFMIGYVLHFFPDFAKIEGLFKSGKLGKLVTCWTRRFFPFCPKDSWHGKKELSGGMTIESFVHDIDWLCSVGGRPQSVYGKTISAQDELNCEDNVSMTLSFKEGIGLSQTSWSSTLGFCTIGIIGTKGSVILGNDGKLRMKLKNGEEEELSPDKTEPFETEDNYFIECILNDRIPVYGHREARLSLEVALAVQESSREDRVVGL